MDKNGIRTVGDTIYINAEGELDKGFLDTMRSGVWTFHPQSGLNHYASHSIDELVLDDGLSVTDDVITTSANHNLKTGDAVEFRSVSGLSGVEVDTVYYVTVVADDEIKLSHSRAGVRNEEYVTITGTATSNDDLFYFPNTDAGYRFSRSAALANTSINEQTRESLTADILWGGETLDADGDTVYVLDTFHDSTNVGSFITRRISAEEIEQTWKDVYSFIDGLRNEHDALTVRVQTEQPKKYIQYSGAWASGTVINTSSARSAAGDISIGDIITSGSARGRSAKITNIETSLTVVSITIDRDIGETGGIATFYNTNFRQLGRYDSTDKKKEYFQTPLIGDNKSAWIKIEVVLEGVDMAVNVLDLTNVPHKRT